MNTHNESAPDSGFQITASHISRKLHTPFVISRGAKTHADCLVVTITFEGFTGRGEGVPYPRYGETIEGCLAQIEALHPGNPFAFMKDPMPAGAARNALNCAFLDLRAKISHTPVWKIMKLSQPSEARGTQTLSLTDPETMAKEAMEFSPAALIKIKLGGDNDIECLKAVRHTRPHAEIIVDANEGWSVDDYNKIMPSLVEAGVAMIEQPMPVDDDEALRELERPITICADESVHTSADVEKLIGKYDMVNIKLDKTGGLTEAVKLRNAALDAGMSYMIGCMVGSSLSMAPAMLLADRASYVDLDGPLFLAEDVEHAIKFDGGTMHPYSKELWG